MVIFTKGNMFESNAEAITNPVNTKGISGAGLALVFKNNFPRNYELYKEACQRGELNIGDILITEDESESLGKWKIINFPSKDDPFFPSQYEYIDFGLRELLRKTQSLGIKSVAIPALGCGIGKLEWDNVKIMMESILKNSETIFYIYEPI